MLYAFTYTYGKCMYTRIDMPTFNEARNVKSCNIIHLLIRALFLIILYGIGIGTRKSP